MQPPRPGRRGLPQMLQHRPLSVLGISVATLELLGHINPHRPVAALPDTLSRSVERESSGAQSALARGARASFRECILQSERLGVFAAHEANRLRAGFAWTPSTRAGFHIGVTAPGQQYKARESNSDGLHGSNIIDGDGVSQFYLTSQPGR